MRVRLLSVTMFAIFTVFTTWGQTHPASPRTEQRIQREVRHELVMLPYITVFDNLEYKVDDDTVTLTGQVTNPVTKTNAENAVKSVEGVERVNNEIVVLPPSPMDDRLRRELFRAIYGFAPLQKYDMGVIKPIRIVVQNGRVTLDGVVDSQADKDAAGLRANGVPGIFSVTNNLRVQKS